MKTKAQSIVSFTEDEILQGAAHRDKTSYFIFQAGLYEVTKKLKQVTVTGSFRGWSADINDAKWQLKQRKDKIWVLAFENPNLDVIPPGAQFKFRIDEVI
ncbi:MAG: hypothetical protein EAY69_00245 [Cytophagales bacterium]|nr:MAG: hypothetical protein EAY69_00245 [Cytophagales bacterium]